MDRPLASPAALSALPPALKVAGAAPGLGAEGREGRGVRRVSYALSRPCSLSSLAWGEQGGQIREADQWGRSGEQVGGTEAREGLMRAPEGGPEGGPHEGPCGL